MPFGWGFQSFKSFQNLPDQTWYVKEKTAKSPNDLNSF